MTTVLIVRLTSLVVLLLFKTRLRIYAHAGKGLTQLHKKVARVGVVVGHTTAVALPFKLGFRLLSTSAFSRTIATSVGSSTSTSATKWGSTTTITERIIKRRLTRYINRLKVHFKIWALVVIVLVQDSSDTSVGAVAIMVTVSVGCRTCVRHCFVNLTSDSGDTVYLVDGGGE